MLDIDLLWPKNIRYTDFLPDWSPTWTPSGRFPLPRKVRAKRHRLRKIAKASRKRNRCCR